MADEQQAKPSFKHAVVKRALAPVVASAATAVTTYLMRKAVEIWHESIQPKVEEQGGAEALARQAAGAVSSKVAPESEPQPEPEAQDAPKADDRSEERRQREQRRKQRRKALDQAGTS
jgi:hypothetical protein